MTWDCIPSDYIIDAEGGGDKKVEMAATILPERKLQSNPAYFADNTDIHPFWHIHRSCIDGASNCEIVDVRLKTTIASEYDALKGAGTNLTSATQALDVELPCIANTKTIKSQEEVVLVCAPPPASQKPKEYKTHISN